MNKLYLAAALAMTISLGAVAQEKVYLIKGNEVVAKYNVQDVDYVSFHLPEGVVDNTGGDPAVVNKQYVGALGEYFGTTDEVADYQIILSSRPIIDERVPVEFLYLQFMGPAADYHNLSLPVGTYTFQQGDTRAPFTFYPGVSETTPDGEAVGGSIILERPSQEENIYALVDGGSFSITKAETGYDIAGLLHLDNGNVLEFSYTGACVVENKSDEKDPADILPLPDSTMTEDFTLDASEAYYGDYGELFEDKPGFVYNYVYLYDSSYANILEMGFLVDKSKANGKILPKGKYQVVTLGSPGYNSGNNVALGAFQVMGDQAIGTYGCWITRDYESKDPLVSGEIEVLDDFDGTGNLNIKVTLKDNSATPHTVTSSFNGSAEKL